MTVKDLIAELQKYDLADIVWINQTENYDTLCVQNENIDDGNPNLINIDWGFE